MTRTVCVALNSPATVQIAAIQNHCGRLERVRIVSMGRIVFYDFAGVSRNAAKWQPDAAGGLAFARW
jgi:hypothetical protein